VRQRRARPGAIALITVLWGALLLGWLQLTPLYRAADEPTHGRTWCLRLRDGGSYAAPGTLDVAPRVRASFPLANLSTAERPSCPTTSRSVHQHRRAAPRRAVRRAARAAGPAAVRQPDDAAPAAVLPAARRAEPGRAGLGGWSFPAQLGVLRLLSALLLLPLPALAAAAARRLGAAPAVVTAAALLPLAVPQLAHVGASVNNDVLLVLLGAAVAVPLLGVSRVTSRGAPLWSWAACSASPC
jgi:small subunit ribosomal protein S36